MDAQDLLEIGEAIEEFFDQSCTVYHQTSPLGTFGCLVTAQQGAGGSPDARGATASDLSRWNILMLPHAGSAVVDGNRIVTSKGMDLGIVGNDVGKSINAFITVVAAKQTSGAPPVDIVLARWNPATRIFDALPAQEFQVTLDNTMPTTTTDPNGTVRTSYRGALIGVLDADVQQNDRFTYEGMQGIVTSVARSDRTEATITLTRSV